MDDLSQQPFNLSEWLVDRHIADGNGGRTAFRCHGADVTYDDLLTLVERTAGAFAALGVQREMRLLLVMLDSVEFSAAFLGALRIGAIPVPVNPLLPGEQLARLADDAIATIAVLSAERVGALEGLLMSSAVQHVVVVGDVEVASAPRNVLGWDTFLALGDRSGAAATIGDSPGFWLCTSGTTGRPKLAMHRHVDLYLTAMLYGAEILETRPGDRCYSIAPMFHAYGLGNSLAFPLAVGASAVLEPTRPPTPKLVSSLMEHEQPTCCSPFRPVTPHCSRRICPVRRSRRCGAQSLLVRRFPPMSSSACASASALRFSMASARPR